MADARDLIEPVRAFLSAPRCGVLSTIGADGAPRQIVTHYLLGEDHVLINGHKDRRWVANLRRAPRLSLIVHDQTEYLHYVSIRGVATLLDEGEAAHGVDFVRLDREDQADLVAAAVPRIRGFRASPRRC
jgi:PPOX class probable F420-dependent enzyme